MWIIIKEKKVFHEGDERSRTHPGHGYSEYTETVQEAFIYKDYKRFSLEIESMETATTKEVYKAFKVEPITVTKELKITIG